jgi:transposase InsO family protein
VPDSYAKEFIQKYHSAPENGHQGIRRTLWRIKQNYSIRKLPLLVKEVVTGCDTCIRNKSTHHVPYRQMGIIQVPERPWKTISWDFIVKLPPSKDLVTGVAYDAILVIMERLTKYMILVLYQESSTAEQLAYAFHRYVVADHGVPEEVISDRDKLFTSKFWAALAVYIGMKRKLTTAFHPQTNGGNERMNQVVEAYLRCYVNYEQNNWVPLLPMAQFSYNSSVTETTQISLFKANYGYEISAFNEPYRTSIDNETGRILANDLRSLHKELVEQLKFVAERNASYYNKKRSQEPTLKEGDKVYLDRRNIRTKRPSDKLDNKKLGPFKIKAVKGRLNYELSLPKNMSIFPVFHISLLEPAPPGAPPAPVTEIQPVNPNAEYEVEDILDYKLVRGKPRYLIKWKDYPQSENTWEPRAELKHLRAFEEFHRRNPALLAGNANKPRRGRRQE